MTLKQTHLFNRALLAVLFVVLTLVATISSADIVTLKDGTVIEGTVIKEDGGQVVIETTIANIKATKTFPRYKVRSIEYKPAEEPVVESTPQETPSTQKPQANPEAATEESEREESDDPAPRADRPDPVMAMQFTIRGTLGEDFNSRGLKKALDLAAEQEIKHIVFFLDCDRGYLYDSLNMLRLLDEYHEHMSYYAFVNNDLPTSAYVFLAIADRVFLNPRVKLGGDVDYTGAFGSDRVTEQPYRVDLPYRDEWTKALQAAAQRMKKPISFFETQSEKSEQPVEVYGVKSLDERTGLDAVRRSNRFWIAQTTGQFMIDAGLGEPIAGTPNKLGEALGIDGWRVQTGPASRAMKDDVQPPVRLAKRYKDAKDLFQRCLLGLVHDDPRQSDFQMVYPRDPDGTYRFDLDPIPDNGETQKWRQQVDRMILLYDTCIQAHQELIEITKEGQALGMKHALMPELKEGYLDKFKADHDWFEVNRSKIPSKYLKIRPDLNRP